ncbi:hypothetical protein PR048_005939 [Dryococelus australis]|uniref:Endonuclease/exonuclease/phosphatase domain-containing protein n=1 Tax=Dryococelus australis TaxID=614101 RepID=A0ABQ9IBR6_9NEOP|nr:hypothetical protein PR048_005939 [Dryococelus australis]
MSDVFSAWNVHSDLACVPDLSHLLHAKHPLLAALSETWFRPAHRFSMPDYICNCTDWVYAPGDSMAILVHRSVRYHHRALLPLALLEAMVIGVTSHRHAFSLPSSPSRAFPEADLLTLSHLDNMVVLSGDFNCCHVDWHCTISDFRGHTLERLMVPEVLCLCEPHRPTHVPTCSDNRPSVLDVFVTSGGVPFSSVATCTGLDSDNMSVIGVLHTLTPNSGTSIGLDYFRADWHHCHRFLDAQMDLSSAPHTPMELNVAVQSFTEAILLVAEEVIAARPFLVVGSCFLNQFFLCGART